jgi:hypothetical protein
MIQIERGGDYHEAVRFFDEDSNVLPVITASDTSTSP